MTVRTAARWLGGATAAVLLSAGLAAPAAAAPGVEPPSVDLTLGPGGSADIAKVVHTSPVPPNPDIVLLADTTSSMGDALLAVRNDVPDIVEQIQAAQPTAQFGVAEYRDFTESFALWINRQLTGDLNEVQLGVDQWTPVGGGDTPEAWIYALYQIGSGIIPFRPNSTRIVAFFGDASSHDPSGGFTLADAIAALNASGVRVVAINVPAGGDGLDAAGQATAVTGATGGVYLDNVPAAQVAQAILDGIGAINVTVTPSVVGCDPQLSLSFAPASRVVESGADATFTEHVTVAGNAAQGTYHCTVDFLVNGMSNGFVQQLTVRVPGLSITDVSVGEGGGPATFTVALSGPSPAPVTVHAATANGTATAPADYATTSVDLTFTPGQVSKQVVVPIVNDTVDEPNETFTVTLSAASGAALADPTGLGTIVDNDRDGAFSCQATVLNVAGAIAVQANPPTVPCADDVETLGQTQLSAGLITVTASTLRATTDQTPDVLTGTTPAAGDRAAATATVETTRIATIGLTIELGAITSTASVTCVAGPGGLVPSFAGSSTVTSLKINGISQPVGSAPLTIPLVVGTLSLNSTVTTSTGVVQRAVALDTLLVDVIVGEAKAGVTGTPAHPAGNPCRA